MKRRDAVSVEVAGLARGFAVAGDAMTLNTCFGRIGAWIGLAACFVRCRLAMPVVADLLVGTCMRYAAGVICETCQVVAEEAGAAVIILSTTNCGREVATRLAAQRVEFRAIGVCLARCHRLAFPINAGLVEICAGVLVAAFDDRSRRAFAVYAGLRGICAGLLRAAFGFDGFGDAGIVDTDFIRVCARLLVAAFGFDGLGDAGIVDTDFIRVCAGLLVAAFGLGALRDTCVIDANLGGIGTRLLVGTLIFHGL